MVTTLNQFLGFVVVICGVYVSEGKQLRIDIQKRIGFQVAHVTAGEDGLNGGYTMV
jgi:hypothetical protein